MKNNFEIYILLVIFISGCDISPSVTSTPAPPLQPNTPITIPSATPNIDTPSAINVLNPKIEKLCPSNPEVSLEELELPNEFILLAVDDEEVLGGDLGSPLHSEILSFSSTKSQPDKIEKIRSFENTSAIINIRASPSGKLLAIFRWDANSNRETLWISTLDGQNQWIIADISPKQRVTWVNDSEILVVGVLNEDEYEGHIPEEDMRPLFSVNPLTSEARSLEPLPEGGIYVYGSYHSRGGKPYSIFYKNDNQTRMYFLYEYAEERSTQVFRWINAVDSTVGVGVRSNGLYYVVQRVGNGVDFAVDLSTEQISENKIYNDIMKRLSVDDLVLSTMFNWTTGNLPILTSSPDPLDEEPTPMYLFDHKANILKDYCIDLGSVSAVFSPDEQFVAFTIYEGIDTPGYHVVLLNLKTGYYAIIRNTKAIGFGKKD